MSGARPSVLWPCVLQVSLFVVMRFSHSIYFQKICKFRTFHSICEDNAAVFVLMFNTKPLIPASFTGHTTLV